MDTAISLPLAQTVFLPKTAMGIKSIENIHTKVYVENVLMRQGVCLLRGFYELALEYRGIEGRRLYKHRFMLPLKVELPGEWPWGENARCDAADIHAVISKPAAKVLSPYVVEFWGRLRLEYINSAGNVENTESRESRESREIRENFRNCVPDYPGRQSGNYPGNAAAGGRHHWCSEIPPVTQDDLTRKLESKIDSMFFSGRLRERGAVRDMGSRLPVWQKEHEFRADESDGMGEAVMSVAAAEKTGESSSENFRGNVSENVGQEAEGRLPVWRRRGDAERLAAPGAVAVLRDKILGRLAEDNGYAANSVFRTDTKISDSKINDAKISDVKISEAKIRAEDAGNEGMKETADEADDVVLAKAENSRPVPPMDRRPSRNSLHSMLTAAAISRMEARGESLRGDKSRNGGGGRWGDCWRNSLPEESRRYSGSVAGKITEGNREAAEVGGKGISETMKNRERTVGETGGMGEMRKIRRKLNRENAGENAGVNSENGVAEKSIAEKNVEENGMAENGIKENTAENRAEAARSVSANADRGEAVDNVGECEDMESKVVEDKVVENKVAENRNIERKTVEYEADSGEVVDVAEEVDETVVETVTDTVVMEKMAEKAAKSEESIKEDSIKVDNNKSGAKIESEELSQILSENAAQVFAGEAAVENVIKAANETVIESAEVMPAVSAVKTVSEKAAETEHPEKPEKAENMAKTEAGNEPVRLINTNGVRLKVGSNGGSGLPAPMSERQGRGRKIKYYIVKPGDQAMGVALQHNVSLESLLECNRLNDGEVTAGMVLRIPVQAG